MRNLVVVFGDQLDASSAAFDGFDAEYDAILMMEVREEAAYIPQHKRRLVLFFSAMRHFAAEQRAAGRQVHYVGLDDSDNTGAFESEIERHHRMLAPRGVVTLQPGDWRVAAMLDALPFDVEVREDRHFLCPADAFGAFLDAHPNFVLDTFYRFMRRRLGILMDKRGKPLGGAWSLDADNRKPLPRRGGPSIPPPPIFAPDATTRDVMGMVERAFPDAPGRLDGFDLPVTRAQARHALENFVTHRLPSFGSYQDAMRTGEPFLFHSLLSAPLNLHLLTPRDVIEAVLDNPSEAPLNAVEGFLRQVIGWREFVRGLYWALMPGYAQRNALGADLPMPRFFWTGETDMRCLQQAIGHTVQFAYAHHIERLMVLGQFALLLGVRPYDVHRWHMSMFVDAIDWVSLPNTLGMSQHADGGVIGTKPYAASGSYINRMSDHCRHCRYDPAKATGDDACPFTTLYWDFLARHDRRLRSNPRMKFPYANLDRKERGELREIRRRADGLRVRCAADPFFKT